MSERTADQFVDLMADDRQWMDTLAQEQYERSTEIILACAHLGLCEDDCRFLCSRVGITYADIEHAERKRIQTLREVNSPLPF